METNILKDIIQFSKAVKGCKLSEEILTKDSAYIQRIETYFGTTRFQSILLVAVFDVNSEGKNRVRPISLNILSATLLNFLCIKKRWISL